MNESKAIHQSLILSILLYPTKLIIEHRFDNNFHSPSPISLIEMTKRGEGILSNFGLPD